MIEKDLPRERVLQRRGVAIRGFANAREDDKHLCGFNAAIFLPKCRSSGLLHGEVVAGVEKSIGVFRAILDPQLHSGGHGHEDVKPCHRHGRD